MYEGFIRGKISFKNNSLLHFREFVHVEILVDRKMYSYQYMSSDNNLIFRYDNTEHHRKLNLATLPHHKHDGSEENVDSTQNRIDSFPDSSSSDLFSEHRPKSSSSSS